MSYAAQYTLTITVPSAHGRVKTTLQQTSGKSHTYESASISELQRFLHEQSSSTSNDPETRWRQFLQTTVVGSSISEELDKRRNRRVAIELRLPAPDTCDAAAELLQVPWELVTTSKQISWSTQIDGVGTPKTEPPQADTLRVLLIYVDDPDYSEQQVQDTRRERKRLSRLFIELGVEVHVLCFGVSLDMLHEKLRSDGPYHIVHWNGRVKTGSLELLNNEAKRIVLDKDTLQDLVTIPRFVPPLFFLSLSWAPKTTEEDITTRAPCAEALDVAMSLRQYGASQVVTMRHRPSPTYITALAEQFYKHLLQNLDRIAPADALASARLQIDAHKAASWPTDHCAPLLLGDAEQAFRPPRASHRALVGRLLEEPPEFVGRTQELLRLNHEWLLPGKQSTAVIHGEPGAGKTMLANEFVEATPGRFDCRISFELDEATRIEDFFYRVDKELRKCDKSYCEDANDGIHAVYIDRSCEFVDRHTLMQENLAKALAKRNILVVIDNFHHCILSNGPTFKDTRWAQLVDALEGPLVTSRSRLLIISNIPFAETKHRLLLKVDPWRTSELQAECEYFSTAGTAFNTSTPYEKQGPQAGPIKSDDQIFSNDNIALKRLKTLPSPPPRTTTQCPSFGERVETKTQVSSEASRARRPMPSLLLGGVLGVMVLGAVVLGAATLNRACSATPEPPGIRLDASMVAQISEEDQLVQDCQHGEGASCSRLGALAECDGHANDARKHYELACSAANALGCFLLGRLHHASMLPPDTQQALSLYRQACTLRYGPACLEVGRVYEPGVTVNGLEKHIEEDINEAAALYEKACLFGHGDGCVRAMQIITILTDTPNIDQRNRRDRMRNALWDQCMTTNVSISPAVAGTCITKDDDVEEACRSLIEFYYGHHGSRDGKEINTLMTRLNSRCSEEYAKSCHVLADLLQDNYGSEREANRITALYERACHLGDPKACKKQHQISRD